MPNQDGRLSLVELIFIVAVFILQQFENILVRLQRHAAHVLHAAHALQLALLHLHHLNHNNREIHLSTSRMVPQPCTDADVTTPLLERLMWQEHSDLLRRTHLQMQISRILMQRQQARSRRPRQNLVSTQDMATQTSPDQFGTVVEAPPEVTCPKTVTSGTAPDKEPPTLAVTNPGAVSSQTVMAPTAAAAATTTAAGIPEYPRDQAPSTMTQGDSGYSSAGLQDGACSREPLPFRPGDMNNVAPKNGLDRNRASSGGGISNNSDDDDRDDEENG